MKTRLAFILSAVLFAGFANPVFAEQDEVLTSTDTKVKWPDYRSAPWTAGDGYPLAVEVKVPVENNRHIMGPARYSVVIGTRTEFVDSVENPMMGVIEDNILGQGAYVRMLFMRGFGLLAWQLKVDGNWQDIPLEFDLVVEVLDAKSVVSKGVLKGVILIVREGKKEVMRVVVENKSPVRPKK